MKIAQEETKGKTFGQFIDDTLSAIKGFFSKQTADSSTDKPRLSANSSKNKSKNKAEKAVESGLKASIRRIAKWIHQNIKEGSKVTASYFCPLAPGAMGKRGLRSHSSRSNRKHSSNQPLPNPISFLTHWAIYWVCFCADRSGNRAFRPAQSAAVTRPDRSRNPARRENSTSAVSLKASR